MTASGGVEGAATAPPVRVNVLPRGLVVVLGAAATVIAVDGLRQIGWLLGPAFLALMLVVVVSPVQGWLIRHRIPRWISTVVVLLLVYLVLVALVATLTVSVAQLATLLPDYADQANALLTTVTDMLARYGMGTDQITEMAGQVDVARVVELLTAVLSSLTNTASTLVLVLALLLFIGLDAADFPERVTRLWQVRPSVAQALLSFARGTRRYLVVASIFGAIVAVLDAVALQLLSVPLPWLWAVLAFMTNYIPNVGFVIGLVPPAMLGLLTGGVRTLVLVVIVYTLINVLVQTVIQPKFVGDSVGLSVTVTFVATAFWAWVLGPLGALLAIPITLLAKALLVDVDPASGWIDILIGPARARQGGLLGPGRPAPIPDEPVGSGGEVVVDHPSSGHPATGSVTDDHPTDDHPTDDHPTDDHVAADPSTGPAPTRVRARDATVEPSSGVGDRRQA